MNADDPLSSTSRKQADAADPAASVWVSANAGAGKTHVLMTRVLRLLLSGTLPERILCLTYTKAAAAEMEDRVFGELAKWATAAQPDLQQALRDVLARPASADEMALARRLFARTIETPGGLKVETIHAFCQRLLQRFPLEAAVPPGFTVLDEETSSRLLREAIDHVLLSATTGDGGRLEKALRAVVVYAQGDRFDDLVAKALAQRKFLSGLRQLGDPDEVLTSLEAIYRDALGLKPEETTDRLAEAAATVLPEATLVAAARALAGGSITDRSLAEAFAEAARMSGRRRLSALREAFLTGDGKARTRYVTKAIQKAEPTLYDALVRARDAFEKLTERRLAAANLEATLALLTVADAIHRRFEASKTERGLLDFDDLVTRTASLLVSGETTAWVQYKLDGGLDHVLVDEAQDTSPEQWRIIESIAREFFAGLSAQESIRTVFAVGDEKQSIYSFQGADPEQFALMGRYFERIVAAAASPWRRLSLDVSFRTVAPILHSVDRVFADHDVTPGLTAGREPISHRPKRLGQAGEVQIWEPEPYDEPTPSPAFSPLAERPSSAAVKRLAQRIARTIDRWLKTGERLASQDRPITPGDVMILVRRRRPFAPLMVAALKELQIPVAGADRMVLRDQLVVKDLVALGRVLALPEDDLSLACVLKSPIFDLDDEALLAVAPGRTGSLYTAVLAAPATDRRFAEAAERLRRWRGIADFLPPFELFSQILDNDNMRARLLGRLGHEAAEAIDEFLTLALGYDDRAPASLAGFIDQITKSEHVVKRDLDHGRNEVRVLTVHGAKGLEAPIVFLPDTTTGQTGAQTSNLIALKVERPTGIGDPWLWTLPGSSGHPTVHAAKAARAEAEAEEANRLLYVAMTRARDRLYVAGWETARARPSSCWYDKIRNALSHALVQRRDSEGAPVWCLDQAQEAPPEIGRKGTMSPPEPVQPPRWAFEKAPSEQRAAIPVAPSRLAPLDMDLDGEPAPHAHSKVVDAGSGATTEPPAPSPKTLTAGDRFLRGTLTHVLLEHLPGLPENRWESVAESYVALRAPRLSPRVRRSIVQETLAVLSDQTFGAVFGTGSRPEIPLVAELPDPTGRRLPLRINGQIDRLVRTPGGILILDYKTNRPPPTAVEDVPLAYLLQLSAYRLALGQLYGTTHIRAAILWTYGPRLMELPTHLLDAIQPRLWELAGSP